MPQGPGFEEFHEIYRGRRYAVLRGRGQDGAPLVAKRVQEGPLARASSVMLRHEYSLLVELQAQRVSGVVKPLALMEHPAEMPTLLLEDAGPHNLEEWLDRRPTSVVTFLEMARQLASTLMGLHQRCVIHQDINPTNIVVASQGTRLTLIDFDLATQLAGLTPSWEVPEELQWALQYVAPEQTGRMNRLIDHRADLYSLGVTLYQMLTGSPPFVSPDPSELIHAHLARPPVSPARSNPAVPKPLSDLVMKLLAKMP
jgi:serine/threonine protein kinase